MEQMMEQTMLPTKVTDIIRVLESGMIVQLLCCCRFGPMTGIYSTVTVGRALVQLQKTLDRDGDATLVCTVQGTTMILG
jgi:hypothetical protein